MAVDDTNDDVLRDILLPPFIAKRPDGVFVYLPKLKLGSEFEMFVNRLFGTGLILRGLEYIAFQKLLYDEEWLQASSGKNLELKLAADIERFPAPRRALYHGVKLVENGKSAEYMFEPVSLEVSYQEPVYGEPDELGVSPILEYRTKVRLQPAQLDFDEFVADMWMKDVRFGIDTETVRQKIQSGVSERVKIAYQLEPTEGRDAEIIEASPHLHRDNSPKILANGKADLRVFKNRFPQMAKGERMIKKVPRVLGKPGRKVSGHIIEPKLPKDLDLASLASVGTNIEQGKDGEYIVASMDGFLTLDTKTNQVSVTEKIESKAGISVRTTGDLDLSVDEFIEHGEVQEGRLVEGKHMTFLSDVFGKIVSQGGDITIKGNLSGGHAEALGGKVAVEKRISRAMVKARLGEVAASFAESSTIIGKIVRIEHAVNCEIVADELYAETIEGCSIAARKAKIAATDERRGRETQVTMIIPDFTSFDQFIADLKKRGTETQQKLDGIRQKMQTLRNDAEFARFLTLQLSINKGEVKLSEAQQAGWRKLVEKHAPVANQLARMQTEAATLDKTLQEIESEREFTEKERAGLSEGITCSIAQIKGHTTGQTMRSSNGVDLFSELSGSAIKALLQKSDNDKSRIFVGDSGTIDWVFQPPKSAG